MSPPLITIIGSLNKDLVIRTSRMPSAGESLTASSFATGSGGKGANQAVACARLSHYQDGSGPVYADVQMVGAVGDDQFGHELLDGLKQAGIDTSEVRTRASEQTGVAVVIVEEKTGENRILVSPNANATLLWGDFTHIPTPLPDLIVLQLEIPLDTVVRIIDEARQRGIMVLLNPAPALEIPDEAYAGVTHLILNETEAAVLCNNSSELGLQPAAQSWLDLGVRNVVITLGARGAFYYSVEAKGGNVEVENVKVVDTTAAGDTFVGAYAVRVAQHIEDGTFFDLKAAVKWANVAASKTVEKEGAQNSIPWLDELHSV